MGHRENNEWKVEKVQEREFIGLPTLHAPEEALSQRNANSVTFLN